ncbi:hypothetical protein ACH5RR_012510 [Cinchona calisaya]|uniref:Uncharacterized protein n=1 Tax=Cinchona calisaya TaxID=153742 RepID=A0ABD3A9G2_9GENT
MTMSMSRQNPVKAEDCYLRPSPLSGLCIRTFGANPTVYELDQHPKGREIENALLALGCNPSVPAAFIGKLFVGGSNEVMSLNVQGKLKPMLIRANAIWM